MRQQQCGRSTMLHRPQSATAATAQATDDARADARARRHGHQTSGGGGRAAANHVDTNAHHQQHHNSFIEFIDKGR
jgi:hypothetical protein